MPKLTDYAVNSGYRYYVVAQPTTYSPDLTVNTRFWTLTIHEVTCRHAPNSDRHLSLDYVKDLAANGFQEPTRGRNHGHHRTVWKGCKTCGTASFANEEWMDAARDYIDAKNEAKRAQNDRDRQQWAIERVEHDYKDAMRAARNAWIEQHKAEIAGVEMAAAAEWVAANPERAKLLGTQVTA